MAVYSPVVTGDTGDMWALCPAPAPPLSCISSSHHTSDIRILPLSPFPDQKSKLRSKNHPYRHFQVIQRFLRCRQCLSISVLVACRPLSPSHLIRVNLKRASTVKILQPVKMVTFVPREKPPSAWLGWLVEFLSPCLSCLISKVSDARGARGEVSSVSWPLESGRQAVASTLSCPTDKHLMAS